MEGVLHEVLNLLRGIHKGIEREWQSQTRRIGLTPSQQHIIWALVLEEGLSISELANKTLMHISTAADVVKRMEEKGLVRVEADPRDDRALSVYLTELGRAKRREALALLESREEWPFFTRIMELPSEEREMLLRILREWGTYFQGEDFVGWIRSTKEKIDQGNR